MSEAAKSQQARALKKNALLRELIAERLEELVDEWRDSEVGDAETREAAYLMHRATTELRDYIYARTNELAGDG